MTIDSFDIVLYTAIFVLPGFLINSIIDTLNPTQKKTEGVLLLKSLTYSIIHCAVWSWAYKLIFKLEKKLPYWYWVILIGFTLIAATTVAVLIGIIKQKQLVRKVLSALKIYCPHSIPNSWDYAFARPEGIWVIVTLTDDSVIYGEFSTKSFASSDPEERDLFIEKIYIPNEKGEWIAAEKNDGIYIHKDQIKTIEFLRGT